MLELMSTFLYLVGLFGLKSSIPSSFVSLRPFRLEEFLISVSNIIDLIRELIHVFIVELDTVFFGLLKVLLEHFADVGPFLDHLLTKW
jgi:hypothetical protein